MTRKFVLPAGIEYPATAKDLELSSKGQPHKRTAPKTEKPVPLPYPEIEHSWVAQGAEEVNDGGV
jgi:hypothetical protein